MRPWKIILIVVGAIVVVFTALVFPQVWPVMKIMRENRWYSSEAEAKTALTRNPNDAMAHFTLAIFAHRRGDHKTRIAELETAHQLDPANEWYILDLSVALQAVGRSGETIPLLKSITNPRLIPEANTMLQRIAKASTAPIPGPTGPVPR